MRTSATDSGAADGWRGARIGAEARDRAHREATRIPAEIDLGEPRVPVVTTLFLALTLVVTLWEFTTFGTSPTASELARAGGSGIGAVATGAWWKLLTANLLHANLAHLAMNAFVIYLTGRWLEHLAGRMIVAATIAWSALLASVGAIWIDVAAVTIGASGVAFGLVGCAVAIDPRARTATGVLARQLAVVNVIITFVIPGISIGGHLGGLAAGLLVGLVTWNRAATAEHPIGRPRRLLPLFIVLAALPPILLLAVGAAAVPGKAEPLRSTLVAPLLGRQLSGAELTGGTTLEDVSCRAGSSPAVYMCTADGSPIVVTFASRDDQWSITGLDG